MASYLSVDEARDLPGLRLVLSAGVPGPWGEAAKGVFRVKGIDFARVRQDPGLPNQALAEWTGRDNAPLAVWEREPARGGWDEIVLLAERLAPDPPLLPGDPEQRALVFGLGHELCGEWGFGWARRLMMLHEALELPELPAALRESLDRLAGKYGYSPAAAEAAPARAAEILRLFAQRLHAQRARGSRFLVGDRLSACDVHWAAFAAMLEPLPREQCPMADFMRRQYRASHPALRAAADPILLEHRDFVYGEYLGLPLDL